MKWMMIFLLIGCQSLELALESSEESQFRNKLDTFSVGQYKIENVDQLFGKYKTDVFKFCPFRKFKNHDSFTRIIFPAYEDIEKKLENKIKSLQNEKNELSDKLEKENASLKKIKSKLNVEENENKIELLKSDISRINEGLRPNCNLFGEFLTWREKETIEFMGTATCNNEVKAHQEKIVLNDYEESHILYNKIIIAQNVYYVDSRLYRGRMYHLFSVTPTKKLKKKFEKEKKKLFKKKKGLNGLEDKIKPFTEKNLEVKNIELKTEEIKKELLDVNNKLREHQTYKPRFF